MISTNEPADAEKEMKKIFMQIAKKTALREYAIYMSQVPKPLNPQHASFSEGWDEAIKYTERVKP